MLKYKREGNTLTAYLRGELDHASAEGYRVGLETLLEDEGIRQLVLDVSGLTFMDSSGIGVVIGRYKTMKKRGGSVILEGASGKIERLFEMAGIYRIVGRGSK